MDTLKIHKKLKKIDIITYQWLRLNRSGAKNRLSAKKEITDTKVSPKGKETEVNERTR